MERTEPISVGVRAFCAFVAKSGDLDHRFTPAPSAEEGMAGHRLVVARRGPGYQQEVALEAIFNGLRLRGRVDGLDTDADALEEIKTFRGDLAAMPDNHRALHRAQLETYGALYCLMHAKKAVDLRLVYFDVDRREEQIEALDGDAARLIAVTEARAADYLAWAQALEAHRLERDRALQALPFPYATLPQGQRQLMEAVDAAMDEGHTLLAQAPTGVGKTLGVLVPSLRALGRGAVDRLFYLTAKTSTQFEAQKALDQLQPTPSVLPLRVLTLTSREKACEHPDKACHGASCPLARGFFDRLPAARIAARDLPALRLDTLRVTAAQHQVCPYYLGQEMARWADVIIGDVHYYFDRSALLYALSLQNRWRPGVLVDEAHNLIERARDMYSAAIAQAPLRDAGRGAPSDVRQALARLDRCLDDLAPQDEAAGDDADPVPPESPPEPLVQALNKSIAALGSHLNTTGSHTEPELLQRYFELLAVQRLAEEFGRHALCEVTTEPAPHSDLFGGLNTQFAIHNVIPAPHLAPAIYRARALIGFSATLTPPDYHRRMWGLPEARFRWCDAPSAFDDEQLRVRTITRIPTRMAQRQASAAPIATLIATQFRYRPGNYLA
ncbi:MAG: ATP-dependent DNA helicase, partial [Algiphilus sp.]